MMNRCGTPKKRAPGSARNHSTGLEDIPPRMKVPIDRRANLTRAPSHPKNSVMLRATIKFLGAAFIGGRLIWSAYSAFAQALQYDEDGIPYQTRPIKICGADPDDDVSAPGYMCVHPAPPPDFDPFSATAEELEKYGYPPKPTDPEMLENWSEIVSVPVVWMPDGAVITLIPQHSSLPSMPQHSPVQLAPDQPPP
jgi:hypothetical protein